MVEEKNTLLDDELEEFESEKEKVRQMVGQIGGTISPKHERVVTFVFLLALIVIFAMDVSRHFFGVEIDLPPLFSLEVAVLLVSMKIIWMINKQTRVDHFQFWILNSIEFRLNEVSKQLRSLQERLDDDLDAKASRSQSDTTQR